MELSALSVALDAAMKLIEEAESGWKVDSDRVKELERRSERTIEALRQPGVDFQSRTENALRILRGEGT